jgi:hypothetical protein
MLCFIACFIGGNSKTHKRLDELLHRYSPDELIQINGRNWTFIGYLINGDCWMYSCEKCTGKFITTFGLFHLNAMGDFIQLSFADGNDKIETAHDHEPEICCDYVQIRLKNEKRIDIELKEIYKMVSGKSTYIGVLLAFDYVCSIGLLNEFYNYKN